MSAYRCKCVHECPYVAMQLQGRRRRANAMIYYFQFEYNHCNIQSVVCIHVMLLQQCNKHPHCEFVQDSVVASSGQYTGAWIRLYTIFRAYKLSCRFNLAYMGSAYTL